MPAKRSALTTLAPLSALLLMLAACGEAAEEVAADGAVADEAVPLEIVVFSPPSLGAFLPAVIAERRTDLDHGLDITFVERPPDAYNTEFGTGQFQVGGSGSIMSEAVRLTAGVDVVYLFNVHDYWGGLVSTTPEITSIEDLDGHSLSGVTGSTNYAMFLWFAQAAGVDMDTVRIENHTTAALGTQAQVSGTDAVQIFEPGYTNLMAQELEHVTDVPIPFDLWEQEFGSSDIPFLGVAAHREWVEENGELIPRLRAVYEDAAAWSLANPQEAAEVIAGTIEGGDADALAGLLADNDRLGLNVRSASEVADGIRSVFEAGVDIGYFEEPPSDDVIYQGG